MSTGSGRSRLSERIRKATARVATGSLVLAGAGVGVVAMSGVALAHTGSLYATAVCNSDGTYTATYTGTTNNVPASGPGHTATFTVGEVLPAGTTITGAPTSVVGNTSYSFQQTGIPGTATAAQATAFLAWGDGVKSDPQGKIALGGTCTQKIAPGTAVAHDTTCAYGGNTGDSWSILPADHVTYAVTVNGNPVSGTSGTAQSGDRVVVVAHADSGYTFSDGSTAKTILDHTFSDEGACQTANPGAATATDVECVSGETTSGSWSYTPADHVTYAVTVNGNHVSGTSGSAQPGDHVVIVATADAGFTFGNGKNTATILDHTFGGNGACQQATPAAPTVSQATCDGTTVVNPSYTIPATTGVDYFVDGASTPTAAGTYPASPGSTVTVTAAPQAGYTLGNAQSTFTLTFDALQCVATVSPTVTLTACTEAGTTTQAFITIPTVEGVQYEIDGVLAEPGDTAVQPGTYTVTAVPGPGVTLVGQTTWDLDVPAAVNCVVPVVPSVSNAKCVNETLVPASYTIPDTTGVDYSVGGQIVAPGTYPASAGSTVIVTAAPQAGYEFPSGTTSQWELTFTKAPTCVLGKKITKHHHHPKQPSVQPQVLPFTGAPTGLLVLLGLATLTAGAALTTVGRRRSFRA